MTIKSARAFSARVLFGAAGVMLANAAVVHAGSQEDRMEWFQDAKFGMFIHFGASEDPYEDTDMTRAERHAAAVHNFNPVDFDAMEWLNIAKDGGAKYIVFTTKHHDGFCKWDSALTDWDVMDASPFKRDIVGELAEACKATDIGLGFYYSVGDWHHPEYDAYFSNRKGFHYSPNPDAEITKYMKYMYGQLEELCVKYNPSLFWFDGSSGFRAPERRNVIGQEHVIDLLHSYGAISNSRLGDDDGLRYVDYLSMGDNQTPPSNLGIPFEAAGTMNNSWHIDVKDHEYKSASELIDRLIKIVGKGGYYLLNVGPDDKGVIPEPCVTRLKTMGDWLEKNGEAIYGTRGGPHPHGFSWGSITQREDGKNTKLYLNVVDWPKDGSFELDGLDNTIISASLLVGGEALPFTSAFDAEAGVRRHTISVPTTAPDQYASVIVLTVEGAASMEQAYLQQNDGSVVLDAYGATIHDKEVIPNKPRRAVDFKQFTVPKKGKGLIPARMLSVGGLSQPGQALSWDFRAVEPGTYEVAVYSIGKAGAGPYRATVAGQTVKGVLTEHSKTKTIELSSHLEVSPIRVDVIDPADGSGDFTGKLTPLALAAALEEDTTKALELVSGMTPTHPTLECEIMDVQAWSHLGLHFAKKLRAAVALNQKNHADAVKYITEAQQHWRDLVSVTEPHYIPGYVYGEKRGKAQGHWHWSAYQSKVDADVKWVKEKAGE